MTEDEGPVVNKEVRELWKEIPGIDGYYASNLGRIKSKKRGVFKLYKKPNGYLMACIRKKNYSVHRLILYAFRGKSDLHCNHINCIRDDNRIVNLEYVTQQENNLHSKKLGRTWTPSGENHIRAKLTDDKVREILLSNDSCKNLGKKYGVSYSTISHIRKGIVWKHITLKNV